MTLRNRFGDVAVTGMKGGGSIVNASGRVTAVDGSGRYRLENRFGTVEAARLAGDLTDPRRQRTGVGDEHHRHGQHLEPFGNVNAATIRGDAIIVNANGSVEATGISGRATCGPRSARVDFRDVGMVIGLERQWLGHRDERERDRERQRDVWHRHASQCGERRESRQRQRRDRAAGRARRRRVVHQVRPRRCAGRQGRPARVGGQRTGQGVRRRRSGLSQDQLRSDRGRTRPRRADGGEFQRIGQRHRHRRIRHGLHLIRAGPPSRSGRPSGRDQQERQRRSLADRENRHLPRCAADDVVLADGGASARHRLRGGRPDDLRTDSGRRAHHRLGLARQQRRVRHDRPRRMCAAAHQLQRRHPDLQGRFAAM